MIKCTYLDTTFLLALAHERSPFHERASELLEQLRGRGDRLAASYLVRAELVSLLASRIPSLGLDEVYALVEYTLSRAGADVADVDYNAVVREAQLYAGLLRMRLASVLHLLTALALGCTAIATFDDAIVYRAGSVRDTLGIEVVH